MTRKGVYEHAPLQECSRGPAMPRTASGGSARTRGQRTCPISGAGWSRETSGAARRMTRLRVDAAPLEAKKVLFAMTARTFGEWRRGEAGHSLVSRRRIWRRLAKPTMCASSCRRRTRRRANTRG